MDGEEKALDFFFAFKCFFAAAAATYILRIYKF